jgi:hypothetical protein
MMNKREIIDQIMRLNRSASPTFLADFSKEELLEYLHVLKDLQFENRTMDLLAPMSVAV